MNNYLENAKDHFGSGWQMKLAASLDVAPRTVRNWVMVDKMPHMAELALRQVIRIDEHWRNRGRILGEATGVKPDDEVTVKVDVKTANVPNSQIHFKDKHGNDQVIDWPDLEKPAPMPAGANSIRVHFGNTPVEL